MASTEPLTKSTKSKTTQSNYKNIINHFLLNFIPLKTILQHLRRLDKSIYLRTTLEKLINPLRNYINPTYSKLSVLHNKSNQPNKNFNTKN